MNTDKPENPWKKRKAGGREFMPPSRALFAESSDRKGTATWCCLDGETWLCKSASKLLRWMQGKSPWAARQELDRLCQEGVLRWHWIEPNTVRVMAPPF